MNPFLTKAGAQWFPFLKLVLQNIQSTLVREFMRRTLRCGKYFLWIFTQHGQSHGRWSYSHCRHCFLVRLVTKAYTIHLESKDDKRQQTNSEGYMCVTSGNGEFFLNCSNFSSLIFSFDSTSMSVPIIKRYYFIILLFGSVRNNDWYDISRVRATSELNTGLYWRLVRMRRRLCNSGLTEMYPFCGK